MWPAGWVYSVLKKQGLWAHTAGSALQLCLPTKCMILCTICTFLRPHLPWLFEVHSSAFPRAGILRRLKKPSAKESIFLHKSKNKPVCLCECWVEAHWSPKPTLPPQVHLPFADCANFSFPQHSDWRWGQGHVAFSLTTQIRAKLFNRTLPETWGSKGNWRQRITRDEVIVDTDQGSPSHPATPGSSPAWTQTHRDSSYGGEGSLHPKCYAKHFTWITRWEFFPWNKCPHPRTTSRSQTWNSWWGSCHCFSWAAETGKGRSAGDTACLRFSPRHYSSAGPRKVSSVALESQN